MSLLPSSPEIVPDTEPRVVGVDSEDADALMSALSSATARRLLSELHDEPAPPSELADRAETTLQNTQYHLANLEDAGAVEVVGTAYSEKGREMDVYAPADQPLVIFAGNDEQASGLRAALKRLLGGVAALGVGALVVQELFGRSVVDRLAATGGSTGSEPLSGGAEGGDAGGAGGGGADGGSGDGGGDADLDGGGDGGDAGAAGDDAGTATPTESAESATPDTANTSAQSATETAADGGAEGTPTPTESGGDVTSAEATGTPTPQEEAETATPEPEATEVATEIAADTVTPTATSGPTPTPVAEAVDGGLELVGGLPPGLLFFLGGVTVLLAWVLLAYR
jgi:DNA-binding transcriptional ArsR family regulator